MSQTNHATNETTLWNGTYREFFIPAAAFTPDVSAPPQAGTDSTSTISAQDYYAFDDAIDEFIFANFVLPTAWDLGTVKVRYYWTAGVNTGSTVWEVAMLATLNDEDWDVAGGTVISTTVPAPATANHESNDGVSAAVTVDGTPTANARIRMALNRDGSNTTGNDDMAGDAKFLGAFIQYQEATTEPTGW